MKKNDPHIHKELIEACKKGDHRAFKELYFLYAKAMLNVAFRILNNQELAEDIVQEAFIKAHNKINQFQYQATFGAWLKKIVINQGLDHLRKECKWKTEPITHEAAPEEDVDWSEIDFKVEMVKKAIMSLPTGFRLVTNMYLFEGFEHKEIAEVLSISENTSKSQFHRAKIKIKTFIKDYEEGQGQVRAIY